MPTETPVVDPKVNGAAPVVDAAAAAPAKTDPPSVDVSGLVTDLERTKTGLKGLRKQFEDVSTKSQARDKAIEALRAGGDPEAILAAAEAAGIDAKIIENVLLASAARNESPEKKVARELDKRLKAIEERDRALREREEAQEAEGVISELSASLAEELKAAGAQLPLLSKMPDEAARDLIGRAAVWRAEQFAAGEEPSYEEFVAKVNELANADETEYFGGVLDAISMLDREAAHQNKPLVEALAKIGFVPQNEPAGKNERPAATAAHSRVLTDDLTAERGSGAEAPDAFGPKVGRAMAREAEIFRRS